MTLVLEVTPELQTRLREEATEKGLTAEDYARMLLEERLLDGPEAAHRLTPAERKRRLDDWIESHRGLPTLPEEAFHRDFYYGERG